MKYLLKKISTIVAVFFFLLVFSSTLRAADTQWLGYWNFRKGKGAHIIDLSPAKRNGVINNATWVMGRKTRALYFDGDGDYVDVKIPFHITFPESFYFDIWLRIAKEVGSYHVVSCLNGPDKGFALTLLDGKIFFWLPGGNFRNVEGTKRLDGVGWHHIAAEYANGTVKLFLDGENIGQDKRSGPVLIESNILRIGAMNQIARLANYDGVIDELYIADTPYVLGARGLARKQKAKKVAAEKLEKAAEAESLAKKTAEVKLAKAAEAKKKIGKKLRTHTKKLRKKKRHLPKFVYQPQENELKGNVGGESTPPHLVEVIPVNNATNIQAKQNIHMIFSDAESGVDPESVVFVLNGIRRPVEKFFDYLGLLHVKFVPRYGFRPDALIEYNISVTDLSPRRNKFEKSFQFYTLLDVEAPYLENADSSKTSKYMISFYIRDNGWGVLKPSVLLKVNGSAVESLVSGSKKRAFVTYKLSKPLTSSEEILVEVLATDNSPRRNRLSKVFYWGNKGSLSPFAFGNKTKKKESLKNEQGLVRLKTYKEESKEDAPVRAFVMEPGLVGRRRKTVKKKKDAPKKVVKEVVKKKADVPKKAVKKVVKNKADVPKKVVKKVVKKKAVKKVVKKKAVVPKKAVKKVVKKKAVAPKKAADAVVGLDVEDSVIPPHKRHINKKKPEKTVWFSPKKAKQQKKQPRVDKPESLRNLTIPDGMVLVTGGEFIMGSWQYADELPERIVYISSFFIDKYPVTQHEYLDYAKKTLVVKPKGIRDGNLPAVNISWEEAAAYAKWKGRRLPTEAEWEKAARGTDRRIWPWGNSYERINVGSDRRGKLTPVSQFPKSVSPYGCYDMAGNSWEWVSDWYLSSYYNARENRNPQGPASGTLKVVRGGSFGNHYAIARSAYRSFNGIKARKPDVGFRTVLSVKVKY